MAKVALTIDAVQFATLRRALDHVIEALDQAGVPSRQRRGLFGMDAPEFTYQGITWKRAPEFSENLVCGYHEGAVVIPGTMAIPEGVTYATFEEPIAAAKRWPNRLRAGVRNEISLIAAF